MQSQSMTATAFMGNRPHFITWQVCGCRWTDTVPFPRQMPPFDLSHIIGVVDHRWHFFSISCSEIYIDGRRLQSVHIERDDDPKSTEYNVLPEVPDETMQ